MTTFIKLFLLMGWCSIGLEVVSSFSIQDVQFINGLITGSKKLSNCDVLFLSNFEYHFVLDNLELISKPKLIFDIKRAQEIIDYALQNKKCSIYMIEPDICHIATQQFLQKMWEAKILKSDQYFVSLYFHDYQIMDLKCWKKDNLVMRDLINYLFVNKTDNVYQIYTTFPYENYHIKLLDIWSIKNQSNFKYHALACNLINIMYNLCLFSDFLWNSEWFPNRFRNLNGQLMRVPYNIESPFSFYVTSKSGNKELVGLDVDIVKYFAQLGNWNLSLFQNPDGNWGNVINNKTNAFNGLVGLVQRYEAELAISSIACSASRRTAILFSSVYHGGGILIYMNKPTPLPRWKVNHFLIINN